MGSNSLPPSSVFWDINAGKARLVDGLKPGAKVFLDVAEAWRWSDKVTEQETWMTMAKVQMHLRLSTQLVTASVPLSWTYYGDLSWAQRNYKIQQSGVSSFPRGDEGLRGKILNVLVFHQHSPNIMEFYEKKEKIAEVDFYAISRTDKKLFPGFKMKNAFITDRTNRPTYLSWDFEIISDEVWRIGKLW